MKVSYNWLKEYVSLEGVSPSQLADGLTNSGLEIEELSPMASATNLVIGEVLTCGPHPDSDHLNVTTVEYGQGPVQIICGAPNCKAGIKVIVAKVGAVLPEITIKAAKVRGLDSNGMLCSLKELGVNEKYLTHEQVAGIEILPSDAPVGCADVLAYLGYDDVVLDASQTPNRADCMAMWSVAKEVGAVLRREVKLPVCEGASNVGEKSDLIIHSTSKNCQHFLGKVINKLVIKESPEWMKNYLHAAGIKSINNVVDISNYVMLETGQPLHFYDLNKMPAKEITVVDQLNMKLTALDNIEYQVLENDLVITSNGIATGLAGIMGGEDSKIDESTTGIIIESAHFNHVAIRNTAKRVGLMTEASSRFIKGLEPLAQHKAMDRAVQLLIELAEATELEETITFGQTNQNPVVVKETLSHCNQLLGTSFTMDEVVDVLTYLDFKPVVDGDEITCTIPSYRTDILIREDIDEEIIRLIGFKSLKETLPTMKATAGRLSVAQNLRRTTRNILNGFGLSEVVTYTLVNERFVEEGCMPFGEHVALASPMSEERKYIRNSLMHSMMECYSYNHARKLKDVNLFELSNVYEKGLVQERLAILLSGSLQESRLHQLNIESDFYVLKGIILTWLEKLGYQGGRIQIKPNDQDTVNFHPYRSASLLVGNQVVGIFGEVHPGLVKTYGCDQTLYAEIILDSLINGNPTKVKFQAIDRYPSVKRDIALVVSEDMEAGLLLKTITSSTKLVRNVEIFDIYTGEHVEKGYKSVALSIIYQANDHTLNEEEINEHHGRVLQNLENKCKANLRG
ncbi:MAG: phenylalanine--tRNA ligase subunit beta [Erysipelotrichaceae bacterium]